MGSSEGVQSVHRALDVLEAVTRAEELGVTQIAQAVGLSPSTAHGLIRTLAMRGYLARTARGYRLGAATAGLSGAWDSDFALRLHLEPLLAELSNATQAASVATVLIGREARIIAAHASPGRLATRVEFGVWKDPFELATGRVLVALGPEQRWAEFIARTSQIPRRSPSWRHELTRIRTDRLSMKPAPKPREIAGMGMPVYRQTQDVICAIGCYVPGYISKDLFNQSSLETLWDVCQRASSLFGGTLPEPVVDFAAVRRNLPAIPPPEES